MLIFVKTLMGSTLSMEVDPSDTVASLKQKILDKTGAPTASQKLLFSGKTLSDDATLAICGVVKESTLVLIVPLATSPTPVAATPTATTPAAKPSASIPPPSSTTTTSTSTSTSTTSYSKSATHEAPATEEVMPGKGKGKKKGGKGGKGGKPTPTSSASSSTTTTTSAATHTPEPDAEFIKAQLVSSFAASSKDIEVVFAFDTTGSMYSVLVQLRADLSKMVAALIADVPNIKIGVMAVGDYGDDATTYVVTSLDLTNNATVLCKWVNEVKATGGDDIPEAYELMLREAQKLSWNSPNRALVVIGDSPPHPAHYTTENINWRTELERLVTMGIKVYGVLAIQSKTSEPAVFYRELAEQSGGVFLLLKQMSLIKDMFMAVCYKEASSEGLEAFRQQVETRDGKIDSERAAMFADLTSAPKKENKETYSYIWWTNKPPRNHRPTFTFDTTTNKWKRHN